MPTCNGAEYISEVLESIALQTLPIDELIISDDESEDDTLSIIDAFAKKTKFPVSILHHTRSGVTKNYLNAIQHASGSIIFIADQDDLWMRDKAQKMVRAFENNEISIVCHDSLLVNEKSQSLGVTLRGGLAKSRKISDRLNHANDKDNLMIYLKGGLPLLAHTLAIRSSIIPDILNKPNSIDDWWFEEWVSMIAITQARLHFVPEHLVLYRQHDQQTSGGFDQSIKISPNAEKFEFKYQTRLDKIHYCRSLISANKSMHDRYLILGQYLEFLESRQATLNEKPFLRSFQIIIILLMKGRYHQNAKGFLSFGLDIVSIFKKPKYTQRG